MTLDVGKLPWSSVDDVACALDIPHDKTESRIASLSPVRFIELYAQWHLGDPQWGRKFYSLVHAVDAAVKDA